MDQAKSNVFLTDFLHQGSMSNDVPNCPLMHIVFVDIKKNNNKKKNFTFPLKDLFSATNRHYTAIIIQLLRII